MPKLTVPVRMRWSDVDGYGHVNNAAMLTILEEARLDTFWNVDKAPTSASTGADAAAQRVAGVLTGGTGATSHTLIARQEIEYTAPLPYSQREIHVDLWISRIGSASLEICYEVFSPDGTSCALAATSVVMVDAATGRARRLTPDERGALEELVAEPISFRRGS